MQFIILTTISFPKRPIGVQSRKCHPSPKEAIVRTWRIIQSRLTDNLLSSWLRVPPFWCWWFEALNTTTHLKWEFHLGAWVWIHQMKPIMDPERHKVWCSRTPSSLWMLSFSKFACGVLVAGFPLVVLPGNMGRGWCQNHTDRPCHHNNFSHLHINLETFWPCGSWLIKWSNWKQSPTVIEVIWFNNPFNRKNRDWKFRRSAASLFACWRRWGSRQWSFAGIKSWSSNLAGGSRKICFVSRHVRPLNLWYLFFVGCRPIGFVYSPTFSRWNKLISLSLSLSHETLPSLKFHSIVL